MSEPGEATVKTIAIAGSLDTKGQEFRYLRQEIQQNGLKTLLIDFGTQGCSDRDVDYSAWQVAAAAGTTLEAVQAMPAAQALDTMGFGAAQIVKQLRSDGRIHGFISMGGGQGTNLAMHCLRALPVGFPKLLLSTLAAVPHRAGMFSGSMDAYLANSVVDISGGNSILETTISNAAAAISGMVLFGHNRIATGQRQKKRVALSMLGVTTPCVSQVCRILEENGVEAVTFIANEQAGKTMEAIIRSGDIDCVADLTLAELTRAYLEDGVDYSDGTQRLEAAVGAGVPMVVSLGGLDLCNLTSPAALIREKYSGRTMHMHNSDICVLRTSPEENRVLGQIVAQRLSQAKGKTALFIPELGLSRYDTPGNVFYDPEADEALFASLRAHLNQETEVIWRKNHINDPDFACAVAENILQFL